MIVPVGIVVDTRVHLFRNDTYLVESVHEGVGKTSLTDITSALADIIILQLVHVFLADDKHLREIVRPFSHTE